MAVKNLKATRIAKGLTHKELATRSGVNRGTIAYYETVEKINPTHIQLRKLADVLGVTPDELVAESGQKPKHFIFDWRDRHPSFARTDLLQNVPSYVLDRSDVQKVLAANPNDNRFELIKLWEYLPSEQYRVTLLSLFYGDEDVSKEFSSWESLFPAQIAWEVRFCDAKPAMDEIGNKVRPTESVIGKQPAANGRRQRRKSRKKVSGK